ncbi:VirB8/TrbF family protein [Larkinella sp. GY13]|uniref:VirB8/TrbF family protein n=1 Tax=Larkinella sp. GY13 TaxID=3453720 RepID=UPI003EED2B04
MEKLFDIDKKFKHSRLLTIIALLSFAAIAITSIIFTNQNVNDFSRRIYVVNKNRQFEAMVSDINQNRPAEIRYHLARFHELFFTISPDPKAVDLNMEKAFYLSDESVKRLYDDLIERNFFKNMVQGNVNQTVKIDTIIVDASSYPYRAETIFKIFQTRATGKTTKLGTSTCLLEDVVRTTNSPNGLIIRDFKFSSVNTKSSLEYEN